MEKSNRNVWIFVVIAVVLLATVCCCLFLAGALALPWRMERGSWVPVGISLLDSTGDDTQRITKAFDVGSHPELEIDNFAGRVTVHAGGGDRVEVVATKKAWGAGGLDRIAVDVTEQSDKVQVRTRKDGDLQHGTVDLEVTAPAASRVVIHSGAGTIEVKGITGSLEVRTGAGTVSVGDAEGQVCLRSGAGTIDYDGRPEGESCFSTGAGTIALRLPEDVNLQVDLSTGLGLVHCSFPVSGRVTRRAVQGTIGSGQGGRVNADTGAGTITLDQQ